MKSRVLFIGHDAQRGLSHTLTPQALALEPIAQAAGFELHIASTANEMEPGLWDQLRAALPPDRLHVLDNESTALTALADSMAAQDGPLILDVHGMRSLRAVNHLRIADPANIGVVYQVHSYRNTTWKRYFYAYATVRMLKKHANFVLFPSMESAQSLLFSKSLMGGGRSGIIPEGLKAWPQELSPPSPDALGGPEIRADLENDSLFKFLYIAHFKPGKGHLWLADAFSSVLKHYPQARLVLAGAPQDEPLYQRVTETISQAGLSKQVLFVGKVDNKDIPWLSTACDAGVIASTSETFGRNYLEPMLASSPVIATRHGIAPNVLIDYYSGIGIGDNDTVALRNAAAYFLEEPDRAKQMGEQAKIIASSQFSWETSARALVGAYEAVLLRMGAEQPAPNFDSRN